MRTAAPSPLSIWCPPPLGVIKFNVDGAVNRTNGVVGVGVITRDQLGRILGNISAPFTGFLSPRTNESLGFSEALIAANNRGLAHIIVEGDSSQIVQALSQEGKIFPDCSSIVLSQIV